MTKQVQRGRDDINQSQAHISTDSAIEPIEEEKFDIEHAPILMGEESPPEWEQFHDTDLLKQWSTQLAELRRNPTSEDWKLCGRCLVVQSDDTHQTRLMIHRAAVDAGYNTGKVHTHGLENVLKDPVKALSAFEPVVVVLEAGPWLSDPDFNPEFRYTDGSAFPQGFIQKVSAIPIELSIVFVVSVPRHCHLSAEVISEGGFDRTIAIETAPPFFAGSRFMTWIGADKFRHSRDDLTKKLGLMVQSQFPTWREQRLAVLRLQRLARSETRLIDFSDIADLALRGLAETTPHSRKQLTEAMKRKVARHEAGHGCTAVIASGGLNVPDYSSIVPAKDFMGIVMESLAFYDRLEEFTFDNMLLKTRILLAGRAAEDYFYGPTQISSGADSDLDIATRMCFQLFAYSGFHPDMMNGEGSSLNLAVQLRGREIVDAEYSRLNSKVREFLGGQYEYVKHLISKYESFYEAVADRLMWDPVVDQVEMSELATKFGIAVNETNNEQE